MATFANETTLRQTADFFKILGDPTRVKLLLLLSQNEYCVSELAEQTGMTKKDTEKALNAAFDVIASALSKGEKVQVSGFGIFEVKEREARMGRNPRTGEAMEIAASRTPTFKASKTLKDALDK